MTTPANTNRNPNPPHLRLLPQAPEGRDCMLDLAEGCASAFPEDVERVERVRRFVHASMNAVTAAAPAAATPPRRDLLFVLGTLIDALAIDCRAPGVRAAIEAEITELLGSAPTAATRTPSSCPCCNQPAHYADAA